MRRTEADLRLICGGLLLAACASYRALPAAPGAQLALKYEQTRLLFFTSVKDDVLVERIFAAGSRIVAVVSRPDSGVFTSEDGGASWMFTRLEPLREVIFDGDRIVGRAAGQLWRWEAGSWVPMALNAGNIDALATGADHALYATAGGRLFVSSDGGRSFRAITLQVAPPFRIRSIAPDPAHANTVYVSVHAERPGSFLARVGALLDRTSDEALAALALVDSPETAPRFGDARDGVYATYDGGALWKKTGLGLDAWLVASRGALYAVAADPLLEAAALSRRYPDLASALERQLHGARADPTSLRAACRFPGRDALLRGTALFYRASPAGLSWEKVAEPPPELHMAVEQQRQAQGEWVAREAGPPAPGAAPAPEAQPPARGRGRGSRGGPSGAPAMRRGGGRAFSPEMLLSLLDPARLLAHFNAGMPLSRAVRAGEEMYAYVPTAAYWDLLTASMASASDSEGEISLGPGWAKPEPGLAMFELLRSNDAGTSWSALPPIALSAPAGIAPYPSSIAPGLVVLSGREKEGQRWSAVWRFLP